jgi:hypothetical protein
VSFPALLAAMTIPSSRPEASTLARSALDLLAQAIEEGENARSAHARRSPRLRIDLDWDGLVPVESCVDALEHLASCGRGGIDAECALEMARLLDECGAPLGELDIEVEIEPEGMDGAVLFDDLIVGLYKVQNTLRDLVD